jgi:hypothetical protein
MKIKTTLGAFALMLAPGLALAEGCAHATKMQSVSQCQPGQVWDAAQQTCVTPANS